MIKKHNLLRSQIFLACCLVVGGAHAQISFSGDTTPTGDFGGREEFRGHVSVGQFNEGTLDMTSGAVFNQRGRANIGSTVGSAGTVNVSGGAEWHTLSLGVGGAGVANLNIFNGGKIFSAGGSIGTSDDGGAMVTVSGPGSSWIVPIEHNHDFWIGGRGPSTLRVLNGGTVSTTSDIYTSLHSSATANIEIDGANSSFTAKDFCWLGILGTTSVKITNGGLLSCGYESYLGWGDVSLSGAGSKWVVSGSLDIGRPLKNTRGELTIGEGSAVEVARTLTLAKGYSTSMNGSGTLNIEGTTEPGILRTPKVVFGDMSINTINFKHTNTSGNYQFTPSISGPGLMNVFGGGTTVLTGDNVFSGHVMVRAGVLRAGSATALPEATYLVRQAGTLDANGNSFLLNMLTNGGNVILGTRDTSTTLSTKYDLNGYGGTIHLNAALGGNASPTQKLVIGQSTNGTATLNIRNLGGAGAQTTGNGILVVQVTHDSNGQFSLPRPGYIQVGAYRYNLVKVGRNWYLQSTRNLIKAASADEQAACTAGDPLAAACTVTPGTGTVAATKPTALTASAADAAAAAETAAPAAETSAELDGTAHGLDDIKDGEAVRLAEAVPVPGLGAMGMVSLSSLMGIAGLRRSRKSA
ncbi:autotransporter outer membrane beta-barrel domain-containing protein [Comamonas koreensis]|uniref:Autotransporter outer membrane beta-barrel domain-containing protein n=1 Tax=Comamonas koreensis TaxID=160825 RepID=A0AAW4XSV2_9BURK|nr:autotransporter outer membrane beta-barrel domain-containing protein [Comamonas koreensis]MCD2164118.1 autotransporter outer membrane beta-barrel domain-containing protein [Comamonas koreensis]